MTFTLKSEKSNERNIVEGKDGVVHKNIECFKCKKKEIMQTIALKNQK